jgi:FkbM family methyltransferase
LVEELGMDRLRKIIKRIPGSVYAVRQLRKSLPHSDVRLLQDGDWLYQRQVVEWLCEPSVRKQLPPLFRVFGAYCAYLHRLGAEQVIGGQKIHKTIISLRKILHLKDSMALSLGPNAVFVDLNDPRMLQVPNEVAGNYPDTSILKRFLARGDTFVDVGANHGSFSIVASKALGPEGLIVAIEPQERKAELVEKSLAANAQCEYQVHRFACGDKTGDVDFFIPTNSSGGAGVFPGYSAIVPHAKVAVSMRRLDDALDWAYFPGRVFMKVDVEGSEAILLRGAREMITSRKPPIMLEINPTSMTASGKTKDAVFGCLQRLGYAEFFEVKPFGGPKPLSELVMGAKGSVRNVIVTARDALLRSIPGIALAQTEDTLGLLFAILSFSLSS